MKEIMQGNSAIARGAWEAGVKVAAAYPGTPSSEILKEIADNYPDIYAEWAPNEKVAVEVASGAAIAGARSMAAMKHVGMNVAADPFMTLAYTGIKGGMVIVVADDPNVHSSQNEQDSRNWARFAKVPMLEPADAQECKDFMKTGFEISEQFDTPVLLRTETRVAHSDSPVELDEQGGIEDPPEARPERGPEIRHGPRLRQGKAQIHRGADARSSRPMPMSSSTTPWRSTTRA